MFSQLRDYHDLGHKRGFPTRISQWMAMQRRQYKVYATGKREAVGIIKSRVMKLNSIGFRWSLKKKRVHHQRSRDVVGSRRRGAKRVLEENDHGKDVPSKEQFALKHNLFFPGKGSRYATSVVKTAADSSSDGTSAGNLKSTGSKPKQTQSSRGRIRVPSRRMQESYDPNKKLMDEKEDSMYHPFSGNQSMEGEEDVSTSDVSEDSSTVESGNKVAKKSSSSGGGGQKSFLECLFELVNDSSVDNPDILAWVPSGDAFKVHKTKSMGPILNRYYRHGNYDSFRRILNMYGFRLNDQGAFFHKNFHRDKSVPKTFATAIPRVNANNSSKSKTTVAKKSSSAKVSPPQSRPKSHKTRPQPTASRAKPAKPQFPKSAPNPYAHPTGHAVAHLPFEEAEDIGKGWITRTIQRINASKGHPKDEVQIS
ncbi:predicted protein [Thalassiosira pseudonana CCMP1335]|uniref:HSF-type DNA-binding domain-containing protein n=1 Tax=Thalassiosira pseudonana TaxID=35128 RepID=B8CB31_THAPS|nr:predicted protein [Thalassiosira pseudonana CCMP1335]EED89247.1 predicted protein [Thalassiosira pseudonana CCMP1335]